MSRRLNCSLAAGVALLAAGCPTMNHTQQGAMVGGGLGALTGAVIGDATGHGPGGALIELQSPVLLAGPRRLLLAREGVVYGASVIWRRGLKIGLAFDQFYDLHQVVDPQIRILQALWKEMALR